jgi:hypothetical protein
MINNENDILESAKKIMNDFMKELDSVESKEEFGQIRDSNKREYAHDNLKDKDFIDRVFSNAPRKKMNFIVAETQKREE